MRETILETARRLFAEDGYDRVTMRRIADEIGYSATAIYYHFPDKRALFHAICDADFDRLQASFAAVLAVPDPVERLRLLGHGYIAFAEQHPHHFRLLFMTRLSDEDRRALADANRAKHGDPTRDSYALLLRTVEDAIAAGRIRPAWRDPHLAAQTLWAAVHGVCALDLDHCDESWIAWAPRPARATALVDAILAGMTCDAPAGREG